jgi:hypothetical protein
MIDIKHRARAKNHKLSDAYIENMNIDESRDYRNILSNHHTTQNNYIGKKRKR